MVLYFSAWASSPSVRATHALFPGSYFCDRCSRMHGIRWSMCSTSNGVIRYYLAGHWGVLLFVSSPTATSPSAIAGALAFPFTVVTTLSHHHNPVSGHRAGSNNSGVEENISGKIKQINVTINQYLRRGIFVALPVSLWSLHGHRCRDPGAAHALSQARKTKRTGRETIAIADIIQTTIMIVRCSVGIPLATGSTGLR